MKISMIMEQNDKLNSKNTGTSKWKKWITKFGIGGLIFFTVKGIISTTLIYFLGKNFFEVIKGWFQ